MYLRKSNESDEKQELSIPAQEDALFSLVEKKGLQIVGEPFRESHTAKRPGRPLFDEMIASIREGKADGIICWHLDRLSRNPFDEASIKCGLVDGTIKEVVTPDRVYKNTPDDGLLSSIVFAMATKYSQDLAINIRRGNKASLERGNWPGKPKIGYKRDPETKKIIRDEERFERVREIWKMRLSGMTVDSILQIAREEWVLTTIPTGKCGGGLLSHAGIWRLLSDPFYTGLMARKEGTFEGNHPPMITQTQFERVQNMVKKYGKQGGPRNRKHFFAYRGLIACGRCNALVTAEYTTNRHGKRYTYWHCGRKNKHVQYCPEKSLEEKIVEKQLTAFLQTLELPESIMQFIFAETRKLTINQNTTLTDAKKKRTEEIRKTTERIQKLRSLCADGIISPEELEEDRSKLLKKKRNLEEMNKQAQDSVKLLEPLKKGVSFANLAQKKFETADKTQKRQIIQSVTSNLILKDKTLLITAKEPFASFLKMKESPDECRWRDIIGKLVEGNMDYDDATNML